MADNLKVLVKDYRPFSMINMERIADQNDTGIWMEVFKIIMTCGHMNYTLVDLSNLDWGMPLNGTEYNGLLGMLQAGKADMILAPYSITHDRMQAIDFTVFLEPSRALLISQNINNNDYFSIYSTLEHIIWIMMFVSVFVVSTSLLFL